MALYYQISQQNFGTESLLSSATQCSSPGISQLHIIKYHPGIDREFYDTLLRCQLVDFNAIIPAFVQQLLPLRTIKILFTNSYTGADLTKILYSRYMHLIINLFYLQKDIAYVNV